MWVLIAFVTMTGGQEVEAELGYFPGERLCLTAGEAIAEEAYEISQGPVQWQCVHEPIAEGVMG